MTAMRRFYIRNEDKIERMTYRHPVIAMVFVQIFMGLFLTGSVAALASAVCGLIWAAGRFLG